MYTYRSKYICRYILIYLYIHIYTYICILFECYPQKVAVVRLPIEFFNSYKVTHRKMLFLKCFRTEKRVVFGLPTENSQCLFLPLCPKKTVSLKKYPQKNRKGLGLPKYAKMS